MVNKIRGIAAAAVFFLVAALICVAAFTSCKGKESGEVKLPETAASGVMVTENLLTDTEISRVPDFEIHGTWVYVPSDASPNWWKQSPPYITVYLDNTVSVWFYETRYSGVLSRIDTYQSRFRVLSVWEDGKERVIDEDAGFILSYVPLANLLMITAEGDDDALPFKKTDDGNVVLTPSEIGEFARYATAAEIDGAYDFIADPNGEYYHYRAFVTGGNSNLDGMYYAEEFTATSTLAPEGNFRYDAENLQNNRDFGGDRSVTWCEGVAGYGIGERVTMRVTTQGFYSEAEIGFFALMIVNGFARNETTWKNNARVKILRLYVGDRHWCDLHLRDVIKPQILRFPQHLIIEPHQSGRKVAIPADWYQYDWMASSAYQTDLSFEIIEVYPGDRFEDTCITGIALDSFSGMY